MNEFAADVKTLRERARQNMLNGAVTENYKANRDQVIQVLNDVLATEIVCTLRYMRHYYMATGINSEAVKAEFLQHSKDEQQHVDWVATRIVQLNGQPNFNPAGLSSRSHSEYVEGNDLVAMIREDLVAERIAIESYAEIIRWLDNNDPTSRKVMEDILKTEEDHAEDMRSLLARLG